MTVERPRIIHDVHARRALRFLDEARKLDDQRARRKEREIAADLQNVKDALPKGSIAAD